MSAGAWLAAEWFGEYPWLEDSAQDRFTEIHERCLPGGPGSPLGGPSRNPYS